MNIDPQANSPEGRTSHGMLLAAFGSLAGLFLICLSCAGVVFLPRVDAGREAARRAVCLNNMKRIGIALHAYHDTYQSYPPAYLADADGRPMHSWRVLLLPFFDAPDLTRAFKRYNFDQAWNSPENLYVAERIDQLNLLPYLCPSNGDSGETNYVAVVGPETVWPAPETRGDASIGDGPHRTILLVEVADSGINWMQPADLAFEQALTGINQPGAEVGLSSHHPLGVNILFCDASVHFLADGTPRETIRALLTAAGGEEATLDDRSRAAAGAQPVRGRGPR